jgi:hypothetical protein
MEAGTQGTSTSIEIHAHFFNSRYPKLPLVNCIKNMSANSTFIKTEWISLEKKWGDVPPHVKRAAKQDFQIPDFIRAEMLPSPGIFIQEMLLDFTLPNATATVSSNTPSTFFSHKAPDAISKSLLLHMRRLPMPTALVVRKLVEFGHQAWLDGYQLVKYTHLCDSVMTHFPLWLIALWVTVLDLLMQTIFHGSTSASCPSKGAHRYATAET